MQFDAREQETSRPSRMDKQKFVHVVETTRAFTKPETPKSEPKDPGPIRLKRVPHCSQRAARV